MALIDYSQLDRSLISVVTHGAVASTARPVDAVVVYWKGSVFPTNAIDGDFYFNTAGV